MPAQPRLVVGHPTTPVGSSRLDFTQDAVTRGAVAVLAAFDPGSLIPTGRAGLIAAVVILAGIALLALLVAAAAHANDPKRRRRGRADDPELFTTTPLPLPKEEMERMAKEPPPHFAFRSHGLPRWVQIGSVVGALAITLVVADRLRDRAEASRHTSDATGDEATRDSSIGASVAAPRGDASSDGSRPFALSARDWVALRGGVGCAGSFEVTKGTAGAWTLTLSVDDGRGREIDSSHTRVPSLVEGTVVEFTFPRTPCSRIGGWRVSGSPASN